MTPHQPTVFKRNQLVGSSLLLLAAIAWGASAVAQKTVLDHLGPLTVTGLSSLIAIAVLWPLAQHERKTKPAAAKATARQVLPVLLLFSLAICLLQAGYGGTSVTNASFVVNCSAVLTPACSWLVLGERPSLAVWPAGLIALAGLWLLGGGFTHIAWGDWLCLAAAGCFSLWFPMAARLLAQTASPCLLTLQQFLFCGIVATGAGLLIEPFSLAALQQSLPDLLVIALISKGLAYLLQSLGQQHTAPSVTAIIVSSEAVFSAIAAHALLGERLSPAGSVGATLMLAAIVISQVRFTSPWPSGTRIVQPLPDAVVLRSRSDSGARTTRLGFDNYLWLP